MYVEYLPFKQGRQESKQKECKGCTLFGSPTCSAPSCRRISSMSSFVAEVDGAPPTEALLPLEDGCSCGLESSSGADTGDAPWARDCSAGAGLVAVAGNRARKVRRLRWLRCEASGVWSWRPWVGGECARRCGREEACGWRHMLAKSASVANWAARRCLRGAARSCGHRGRAVN